MSPVAAIDPAFVGLFALAFLAYRAGSRPLADALWADGRDAFRRTRPDAVTPRRTIAGELHLLDVEVRGWLAGEQDSTSPSTRCAPREAARTTHSRRRAA